MTGFVLAPSERPSGIARPLPPPGARVHFVGIGGVSMSGLARMLRANGYQVSGSDATVSAQTAALLAEGIPVIVGHDDHRLALAADWVITTRAAAANSEVAAAHAAGLTLVPRGELLASLMNVRRGIAVAGSHGKSTTTAMIVSLLRALGAEPAYMIGAALRPEGRGAAPGRGDLMVVEADEFDHAFLWLVPQVAVITNIEYDHPDIFPDQDAYDTDFSYFAANLRPGGTLLLSADDPGCGRLRQRADFAPGGPVVTFGQAADADWRLQANASGWQIRTPAGQSVPLRLAIPGHHHLLNAAAALATLAAVGYDPLPAAPLLTEFPGVGRRFEIKGETGDVVVIDDYAHHPSEIRATLGAARERFPDRRLWAVFQPHTYSRTKALLPGFIAALAEADEIMILDVYAARETDSFGVNAANLRAALPGCHAATDPDDAARRLASLVAPGDVVLTIGAGSVTSVGPELLALLSPAKGDEGNDGDR